MKKIQLNNPVWFWIVGSILGLMIFGITFVVLRQSTATNNMRPKVVERKLTDNERVMISKDAPPNYKIYGKIKANVDDDSKAELIVGLELEEPYEQDGNILIYVYKRKRWHWELASNFEVRGEGGKIFGCDHRYYSGIDDTFVVEDINNDGKNEIITITSSPSYTQLSIYTSAKTKDSSAISFEEIFQGGFPSQGQTQSQVLVGDFVKEKPGKEILIWRPGEPSLFFEGSYYDICLYASDGHSYKLWQKTTPTSSAYSNVRSVSSDPALRFSYKEEHNFEEFKVAEKIAEELLSLARKQGKEAVISYFRKHRTHRRGDVQKILNRYWWMFANTKIKYIEHSGLTSTYRVFLSMPFKCAINITRRNGEVLERAKVDLWCLD